MASSRPRKQQKQTSPLNELILLLRDFLASRPSVLELSSPEKAQEMVASTLPMVSYELSLNEWWHWHEKGRQVTDEASRDRLCQELLNKAANSIETPQLARLQLSESKLQLPHSHLMEALKKLLPKRTLKFEREKARKLAKELTDILGPFVEHDNGANHVFDFRWYDAKTEKLYVEELKPTDGLDSLIFRLWECAALGIRAVTLSLRVRPDCPLAEVCQALDDHYSMSKTICPPSNWCFGPLEQHAVVESDANDAARDNRLPYGTDKRYYLIIGTPGALTKSHMDRGVQTVLYHTVAGTNHALAVPGEIALALQAIDDSTDSTWAHKLETRVLTAFKDVVRAGTFSEGETMLILPGGGHAVLTGDDGKVVLAGEWHLRTDI